MTLQQKEWGILGTVALILVVGLPLLNSLPQESSLWLPDFYLNLLGKYLSLAIMALGLGLLWGYAGILSLGQAVFFGLGGYSMGMYLMLEIGTEQSKYGEALPDFMVWNQVKELPLFWEPYHSFTFALGSAVFLPVLFATFFGYLTFHSRIQGVYVAILTQALAFAAWLTFNRNEMKLGGTNGLTDYKTILGFSLLEPATQRGLYIITAVCLVIAYCLCRWLTTSKLGNILRAIRDSENRLRFLGYSTTGFKVFVFAVSAGLAGLAGALYVPQVGIITPSQIGVMPSLEVVVWVAVGGREALVGGPLGAVLVNALRSFLTGAAPELWPFILGGLFVGVVLLFPVGLVGLPDQFKRLVQRTRLQSVNISSVGSRTAVVSPNPGYEEPGGLCMRGPFKIEVTSTNGQPRPVQEPVRGFAARGSTILYLEGVTVSFEGFLALRNLNFYMEKGELRFVIGPNGAGKTTLLDVVCGRVKPIQGRVIFEEGTDLLSMREHQIANLGIGRKFQTPTVFPHHSVLDNLALSLKADKQVVSTLFARHKQGDRERILQILESVGLIEQADHPAGLLSHGHKQWLEIGMLMAQDPKVLLIDEPVAGMTGKEREETGLLLESIARERSVLVIEHDMEFVRDFARTVTVLHEGSVLCEGPMDKVQHDPRVIEVYLGRERAAHA
ncbi:MAG: urea ABC transporter permease subunit UrtC [Nitrospiria bacterium]